MSRHHCRRLILALLIGLGSVNVLTPPAEAERPPPDPAAGRAVYLQSCARCHGTDGNGDGRDATRLYPKPRDLTSGVFKFRSTASGTAPTDEDLFHTVTHGLTAAGMPDWQHLDEAAKWQLVDYLKSLSPVFQDSPPQLVPLGTDPGAKRADHGQGRAVYEKLGCAACHGVSGRGNGPSAAGLVDNWGMPTRPADLTQGWNYRGGSAPQAIAQRILTGIDGSPMPSYAEAASTEEVWQLAHYVRSLQEEPRWAVIVRAPHLSQIPSAADDPRWAAVPRFDVWVRNTVDDQGALQAPQTVTAVSLQAVADDETLSLRLSWHDPTEDRKDPADALAVVWRPEGVVGDIVTLQTWPLSHHLSSARRADVPPSAERQVVGQALDLCAWSARGSQAREAISTSYEPLVTGTAQGQELPSQAAYEDGVWTLVLTRPLVPEGLEGAAQVTRGPLIPVAFAVWDGGNPGQRAVSAWVDLALDAPAAEPHAAAPISREAVLVWAVSVVVLVVALALALRRP